MKLKTNRFAFRPILCDECKQYILFESYRHYKVNVFKYGPCGFIRKNVCKTCWDHINLNNEVKNND